MDRQLTEDERASFSILYGTIFSMSLVSDYAQSIQTVIQDRGNNYLLNKARAAEKANDVLLDVLIREFTKTMKPENKAITLKAIEEQKNFIYDLMYMEADEQHRIKQLAEKIKRERK